MQSKSRSEVITGSLNFPFSEYCQETNAGVSHNGILSCLWVLQCHGPLPPLPHPLSQSPAPCSWGVCVKVVGFWGGGAAIC